VHLFETFIRALLLGLLASIPLGPIGVIVIRRTLGKGRMSGFISGLGAASADTFLAIIAGLGLVFVIDYINNHNVLFKIIGGIVVIIIGIQIFLKNPVDQVKERRLKKSSLHTDYLSVLFLTLSNPLAVVYMLGLFAGINPLQGSHSVFAHIIVFIGIFLAAASWWFLLSTFVNIYRRKFRLRSLWWLNKITGAIIALFGIATIIILILEKLHIIA
jgi:threonine/homoserine/homoserine lactone efflux protein